MNQLTKEGNTNKRKVKSIPIKWERQCMVKLLLKIYLNMNIDEVCDELIHITE